MSLLSSLRIGQSGLRAASEGIRVVSNNVANASVDGYSRKSVSTSTSDPIRRAGLWLGQGATVDGVTRASDRLLTTRLFGAVGDQSSADTASRALSSYLSGIYDAEGDGLTDAYSGFFDALDGATVDPGDVSQRREVVSAAQTLARKVRTTATTLETGITDQQEAVETQLTSINEDLASVAQLNEAIAASANPFSAGDLMDQRDVILRRLSSELGVEVDLDAEGGATVMLGGHAIVSDGAFRELSWDSANGELRLATGKSTIDATELAGGELGGRLQAVDVLQDAMDELNTWVVDFADAVNAQMAAGFDSNGAAGTDLFTYTAGDEGLTLDVSATIADDPELLAFAGAATAAAGDGDNLALLIDLQEQDLHEGGTKTGLASLTGFVSGLGSTVQSLELESESHAGVVEDLETLTSAVSGVNLDDEALELLELQTAYQSAARVLQTTDKLLDTLLQV